MPGHRFYERRNRKRSPAKPPNKSRIAIDPPVMRRGAGTSQRRPWATNPWASTCCSRMPVIGLVRLQRALGAVMPRSTQSTPDRIKRLGDADTGGAVTRPTLSCWKDGNQSVLGGARKGTTYAAVVGISTEGNLSELRRGNLAVAVLQGASSADRWIAQATNGIPRGCCAETKSHWQTLQWFVDQSWKRSVSKGDALESRSPEIGALASKGFNPNRNREAMAFWSVRSTWITRETLRTDAAGICIDSLWAGAA